MLDQDTVEWIDARVEDTIFTMRRIWDVSASELEELDVQERDESEDFMAATLDAMLRLESRILHRREVDALERIAAALESLAESGLR